MLTRPPRLAPRTATQTQRSALLARHLSTSRAAGMVVPLPAPGAHLVTSRASGVTHRWERWVVSSSYPWCFCW